VGPFFTEENKIVQDFSEANKINTIHPFSNNSEIIGLNPYAFLFQPSSETLGRKAADFIAARPRRRNSMVFYGTGKKDSVVAANFIQQAREKGITIVGAEKINNKDTRRVTDILATPTEFDEFKNPIQFTLKRDSLHSVFVASDDPLIYTKVVGGVQTRSDSTLLIGSENWLDDNAIDFEKYQALGIVLAAPNYTAIKNVNFRKFERRFLAAHGRMASNIAKMGYEFMLFIGNQLKANGVYFQDGLRKDIVPGYLSEGFDYRNSHDNQLIPFIKFKKGELVLIEKR
jgi:hypothetical protein